MQAGDDAGQGRFAAARFTDQRQHLLGIDVEVDLMQHVARACQRLEHGWALIARVDAPDRHDRFQRLVRHPVRHRGLGAWLRLNRAQKRAGVVLLRLAQDIARHPLLDHVALVHDQDPIGDLVDHRQVVGDINRCRPMVADDVFDRLKNLDLGRNVECGGRLVEHQQLRCAGHRHRHHDALLLAAGRLMRIAVGKCRRIGQMKQGKQIDRAFLGVGLVRQAMQQQAFGHLVANRDRRI